MNKVTAPDKNTDPIATSDIIADFHARLIKRFTELRKKEPFSPFSILSTKFKLSQFSPDFIGIVPEFLCSLLETNTEGRNLVSFAHSKSMKDLSDRQGVLLCHALSPFSESCGLYCEIGRGFRVSQGLGLPLRVMLADESWTRYNWVVVDLNLAANLSSNQTWRQRLYDTLEIKFDTCEAGNAPGLSRRDEISSVASDYAKFARLIWGDQIAAKRFTADETKEMLKAISLSSRNDNDFDLFNFNLLKHLLAPHKKVIEKVLENLYRLDFNTFYYFFLQYYHQLKYKGYLKVSICRERDFDDPFREIDETKRLLHEDGDDSDPRDLPALYFRDYRYGKVKIGDQTVFLTAHPYYFPSGTIYSTYGPDLEKAVSQCIMIDDYDKEEKIFRILTGCPQLDKARLLADLLSFVHKLSIGRKHIRNDIADFLRNHDQKGVLIGSWNEYAGEKGHEHFRRKCSEWAQMIFTQFAHETPIPYHFLPYLWSPFISIEDEAKLITIILRHAKNVLGTPEVPVKTLG